MGDLRVASRLLLVTKKLDQNSSSNVAEMQFVLLSFGNLGQVNTDEEEGQFIVLWEMSEAAVMIICLLLRCDILLLMAVANDKKHHDTRLC